MINPRLDEFDKRFDTNSFESRTNPSYREQLSNCSDSNEDVLELTWAVIDGIASVDQQRHVQDLLRKEYESRQRYLEAVQLDCDLRHAFNPLGLPQALPDQTSKNPLNRKQCDGNRLPNIASELAANPMRAAS